MLYFVSGLHLHTDEPLAGLLPQTSDAQVDVYVHLGETFPGRDRLLATEEVWYSNSADDQCGETLLTIWRSAAIGYFRMVFGDGTEFIIDRRAAEVWVIWSSRVPPDDRTSYLLGPALSFVLCLRGVTCLHASAISIDNRAIAFVGAEGAGKSTIAALFGASGHPVLADDLLAVITKPETFLALPGYPRLRLRPDAVEVLRNGSTKMLQLIPTKDQQYLDLDLTQAGYEFESRALSLAAVYFLNARSEQFVTPNVLPISNSKGLMDLMANSWATRVLDPAMRASEFETLSRLSAGLPMRNVHAGLNSSPSTLCKIIMRDFKMIESRLGSQRARTA
jgi:hypothetical protein